MKEIKLEFSEEEYLKLQEIAEKHGITVEEDIKKEVGKYVSRRTRKKVKKEEVEEDQVAYKGTIATFTQPPSGLEFDPEIESIKEYIIKMMMTSEQATPLVERRLKDLAGLDYPKDEVEQMRAQFDKKVGERELPRLNPVLAKYLKDIQTSLIDAIVGVIGEGGRREATSVANQIIEAALGQYGFYDLYGVRTYVIRRAQGLSLK